MTTGIQWTDRTWNPTTGCDRVSPGCDHCYALTMAKRLKGMGSAKYQNDGEAKTSGPGFAATEHPTTLSEPLHWRKPTRVFVNSMSDLFHDSISDDFIAQVFAVMAMAGRHTFQILTKRHGRMRALLSSEDFITRVGQFRHRMGDSAPTPDDPAWNWPLPNVWLGVSAEDQKWADVRVPALLDTPAAVRFLSAEPLLGEIDLRQTFAKWQPPEDHPAWAETRLGARLQARDVLHWVIAGGESGPGARPMHPAWPTSLRDQCVAAEVPFFFKQWGEFGPPGTYTRNASSQANPWICRDGRIWTMGAFTGTPEDDCTQMHRVGKGAAGRTLLGRTWDEFPAVAFMSDLVPTDEIETIVGAARHPWLHYGRAVSAEQKVYILHSQRCFDSGVDLRTCRFSLALDRGIDMSSWSGREDTAVVLAIWRNRLTPHHGSEIQS